METVLGILMWIALIMGVGYVLTNYGILAFVGLCFIILLAKGAI